MRLAWIKCWNWTGQSGLCLSLETSVQEVLWCAPGIEGSGLDADGGLWLLWRRRGCCCAGGDMQSAVTWACWQYWMCSLDYGDVHPGCSSMWHSQSVRGWTGPWSSPIECTHFGRETDIRENGQVWFWSKLGLYHESRGDAALLYVVWACVAGGHVRRRLSCRSGSTFWIQESAFDTGFVCNVLEG